MKKNNVRRLFSIIVVATMIFTLLSNVAMGASNKFWNSGAKINFVPTNYDRQYNINSWLLNSCPELDLTAYEDLTVPATRWNVFAGVLRVYQNYLKTTGQNLLTSNGYTLDKFEDGTSLEPTNAKGEAQIMVRLGILEGRTTKDGLVYMDMSDDITRGETAKILSVFYQKTKGNVQSLRGALDFEDTRNHWSKQYIDYCYERGLLNGKSERFFDPDGLITKEEVIQILINMIDRYQINGITERNVAKSLNETFYVTTAYDDENKSNSSSSTSIYTKTPITSDNYYYSVRPNNTVTIKVRGNSSKRINITAENNNIRVTDTSSSNGVYTVKVKGVYEGTGFLKCNYTSGAADYETLFIPIFVRESTAVKATSLTINNSNISLNVGASYLLSTSVTVSPQNAIYNGVYYASSNPAVASVNYMSGQITANSNGTAYIYAVTYGASRKITVNVTGYSYYPGYENNYYSDFSLTSNMGQVYVGSTLNLKNYVYNNTGYKVTYQSLDTTRASVSSSGVVTGKKSGSTQILVTCNGRQLIFYLTVLTNNYNDYYDAITSITLEKTYVNLSVGGTFDLDAWVNTYPYSADRSNLRYKSMDTSIATVDKYDGVITGERTGRTQIKVYCGDIEKYCTIQVGYSGLDDDEIPVTSLTISNKNISLNVGDVYYLANYVTVLPSDATNKTVYYTSSNPNVVNVGTVSGRIDAYNAGSATITVEAGNKKEYVTVTVNSSNGGNIVNPDETPTPDNPNQNNGNLSFVTNDVIKLKVDMEFNPYSVLIGDYSNVSFSFTVDGIASIKNGRVVGIAPGNTTLIATDEKGNTANLSFLVY